MIYSHLKFSKLMTEKRASTNMQLYKIHIASTSKK